MYHLKIFWINLWVVLVILLSSCSSGKAPPWKTSTPEAQGIDSQVLVKMLQKIQTGTIRLHSLILIRNDRLVLECYLQPYSRETLHNFKSASKSVLSALVGIAFQQGLIDSLNHPVLNYFPQYAAADSEVRKKQIRIFHLLTMTAGFELDENGPISTDIRQTKNWTQAILAQPLTANPGQQFNYTSWQSHLMAGILTQTAGQSLNEFAKKFLFDPLEIRNLHWAKSPEGTYMGGDDLWLTPMDLAKLGVLYLNHGQWQGQSIIPAGWVKNSTENQLAPLGILNAKAGYWWWLGYPGWQVVVGAGGQALMLNSDRKLVLVTTMAEASAHYSLLVDFIGPAIKSDSALPENPTACTALQQLVQALENPEPRPTPVPELAYSLSGTKYHLADNPLKFNSLIFNFKTGGKCQITYGTPTGEIKLQVGLDGIYRVTDTGKFGARPDHNQIALRGRWRDDTCFLLDYHELGTPSESRFEFQFQNTSIQITQSDLPAKTSTKFSGQM